MTSVRYRDRDTKRNINTPIAPIVSAPAPTASTSNPTSTFRSLPKVFKGRSKDKSRSGTAGKGKHFRIPSISVSHVGDDLDMEERSLFDDHKERERETAERDDESGRKASSEGKRPATYFEVSEGETEDESERELVRKKGGRYDA